MARFRILPVLIVAATGLLCLKALGIATRGGYIFADQKVVDTANLDLDPQKARFGRALSSVRTSPDYADPVTTGTVPSKKKKEGEGADAKPEDVKVAQAGAHAPEERPVTQAPPLPPSGTERQLIERLQDRRSSLEQRSRELDLRENLLKAAERKIEDRIGDLKQAETKADVTGTARTKAEQENLKPLVIMYEAMKPKEAARVFEKLDIKVLVPVVLALNPRKMSEILAAMSPDSAEKLTTALALRSAGEKGGDRNDQLPPGELPRLDQKK